MRELEFWRNAIKELVLRNPAGSREELEDLYADVRRTLKTHSTYQSTDSWRQAYRETLDLVSAKEEVDTALDDRGGKDALDDSPEDQE